MDAKVIEAGPEGRQVHYFRAGHGEPLLFLHNLLGLQGFETALAALAERYDVIAPFAPGWGPAKDQLPDIDPGALDITLHHLDVLDAMGVDAAHVVGVSIGAWMAAELAAIAPQRVKSLVLVNPLGLWLEEAPGEDAFAQHPGFPSRVLFSAKGMREQFLFEGREKLEAHVDELLSLRAGAKFLWPIPETGIRKRLPRIKARTLVVTSENDLIVPPAHGPAWQQAIAGASLATLPQAGHLAELEQPAAFANLIGEFLG